MAKPSKQGKIVCRSGTQVEGPPGISLAYHDPLENDSFRSNILRGRIFLLRVVAICLVAGLSFLIFSDDAWAQTKNLAEPDGEGPAKDLFQVPGTNGDCANARAYLHQRPLGLSYEQIEKMPCGEAELCARARGWKSRIERQMDQKINEINARFNQQREKLQDEAARQLGNIHTEPAPASGFAPIPRQSDTKTPTAEGVQRDRSPIGTIAEASSEAMGSSEAVNPLKAVFGAETSSSNRPDSGGITWQAREAINSAKPAMDSSNGAGSGTFTPSSAMQALTEIFGPAPSPSNGETESTPGLRALSEVFGSSSSLPTGDVSGIWQSKSTILDIAQTTAANSKGPDVSIAIKDGEKLVVTPEAQATGKQASTIPQYFVPGVWNPTADQIAEAQRVANVTGNKTQLVCDEHKGDWQDLEDAGVDRNIAKDSLDARARSRSSLELAVDTEEQLRAGEEVRWMLHSRGVIEGKLAYATISSDISQDSTLTQQQKESMLSNLKIIALGAGVPTSIGFEGVGSLRTVVDPSDPVANLFGDGSGAPGGTASHLLSHYLDKFDSTWWTPGKTVLDSQSH